MFRLAHISDIHLGPLPSVTKRELASKRITGYINWKRNRSKYQDQNIANHLVEYMKSLEPDHNVITGDLINLGLDEEIQNAQNWLKTVGSPKNTTVICGNHDAYVRNSLAKALDSWQPYVMGDNRQAVSSHKDFPTLRRRGKISIISCNSARASAPFLAVGFFRFKQAKKLQELLKQEKQRGQCRIVLIHHAPFANATHKHKRLIGLNNFTNVIEQEGAELILHGHTHLDTLTYIKDKSETKRPNLQDNQDKQVPVVCVPAAFQWTGNKKPASGVNIYNIEQSNKTWKIEVERHGLVASEQDAQNTNTATPTFEKLNTTEL
ncbi:MAG: metallophosphoesterase [Nitratireductor sp.]